MTNNEAVQRYRDEAYNKEWEDINYLTDEEITNMNKMEDNDSNVDSLTDEHALYLALFEENRRLEIEIEEILRVLRDDKIHYIDKIELHNEYVMLQARLDNNVSRIDELLNAKRNR